MALADELRAIECLSGFGQSEFVSGSPTYPASVADVFAVFEAARREKRRIVLRGAGRSYGDAAISAGAIVLDCSRLKRVLSWDPKSGLIDCESGATIEDLWRTGLPDGWWPPVVSGTMYPTLGGALAMNIHGKNAFKVGTLGEHVAEIDVATPVGTLLTLTPADERFFAVVSGFGMIGVIVRVKLQMKKVQTGDLKILATSPRSWQEQIDTFERYEGDADYMVSWIDCFGRGNRSGRGQFHAAWYTHSSEPNPPSLRLDRQDLPTKLLGVVPKSAMWRVLKPLNNRTGMHFINWAKDTSGRLLGNNKTSTQSLVAFSFLLDYVPDWRKAYLPGGFIQYQSFVPREAAGRVFARQVELQQAAKLESFLGVMKLHHADTFLISHGVEGYSLALDFKVTEANRAALWDLCHRMNDVVLDAGGRFYFAKDSTLRPADVRRYLGEETVARLRACKQEMDPEGLLTSKLAERVELFTEL
ncbi:MAG: FAD-binding oxidoreductase [Fimbriimonadaceae bacterium]